jgi:hypothetical protein
VTADAYAGYHSHSVTWPGTTDVGGSPITGYAIYRGTAAGAETLVQTLSNGASYVDTDVKAKSAYFYRVAAINRNGTGAQSNEATATPKK